MKAILAVTFGEESLGLMHSHNLRAIVNKLKEAYPNLELSTKDMIWLGDFYFDARCPGDNLIQVHKEDALECLCLTEDLQKKTTILLEQIELDKQQKKDIIQGLDSFEICLSYTLFCGLPQPRPKGMYCGVPNGYTQRTCPLGIFFHKN